MNRWGWKEGLSGRSRVDVRKKTEIEELKIGGKMEKRWKSELGRGCEYCEFEFEGSGKGGVVVEVKCQKRKSEKI